MQVMPGFPDLPQQFREKSGAIHQQHHLIATARGESVDALQFGNLAEELARSRLAMTAGPQLQIMHPFQTAAVDALGSDEKVGQATHDGEEQDRPKPREGRVG